MARYAIDGEQAVASPADTTLTVVADGTTPRRITLFDAMFGSADGSTPSDVAYEHIIDRVTVDGTNTAVTPNPLDPADAAALSVAGENHSAEPTYGSTLLLRVGVNKRATFRWVAAPGSELVAPATASNGFGFYTNHGSDTDPVVVNAMFNEE